MSKQLRYTIACILLLFFGFCSASRAEKADDPFTTGNFALPTSQEPGALVSFGQNIINKNQTQLFLLADDYIGLRKHAIDIVPGVLYGITDNFSVFFNLPYAANYQEDRHHSAGIEDAFVALEYAFYNGKGTNYTDQATIVGSLSVPTGDVLKTPPTGYGAPGLFVGATFNRTYPDWFFYTSHGATITTTHNGTHFGDDFLYQFGLGRNLFNLGTRWLFAWQAELTGDYQKRNVIQGVTDPNSGGNIVYLTPSLWVSSKKLIIQLGVGVPVTQHLYGAQTRSTYLLVSNFGWTL